VSNSDRGLDLPQCRFFHQISTWTGLAGNPDLSFDMQESKKLSHVTASNRIFFVFVVFVFKL
jgi:hypothetical protein